MVLALEKSVLEEALFRSPVNIWFTYDFGHFSFYILVFKLRAKINLNRKINFKMLIKYYQNDNNAFNRISIICKNKELIFNNFTYLRKIGHYLLLCRSSHIHNELDFHTIHFRVNSLISPISKYSQYNNSYCKTHYNCSPSHDGYHIKPYIGGILNASILDHFYIVFYW